MPADPVRSVEPGDRATVLACFDDTSVAAFSVLSRLTAGNAQRALDLLVDTYAYLQRAAQREGPLAIDAAWIIGAAHSVYAALGASPSAGELAPVSALSVAERVVLSLHLIEGRSLDEAAAVLDISVDDATRSLRTGTARLAAAEAGSGPGPADILRRAEVWFDDAMRSHARTAVANGWSSSDTPAPVLQPTPTSNAAPAGFAAGLREPEHFVAPPEFIRPQRSRWMVVGVGVAIAAVVGGLAVWVAPSAKDDGAGSLPTTTSSPSTSTATTVPTSTPSTTDTVVIDPGTGYASVDTASTDVGEVLGYMLDPVPDGIVATGASTNEQTQQSMNWFELWSSPDAARTAGRWFAVLAIDNGSSPPLALSPTSRRVDVGGSNGLIDVTDDGVTELAVELAGRQQVRFESFGLTADDLLRLASATTLGPESRPSYDATAHDLVDGLDLRASRPTSEPALEYEIIGEPSQLRQVSYASTDGVSFLALLSGPQIENDLYISTLLTPDSLDPAASFAPNRMLVIDGRTMFVGQLPTLLKGAAGTSAFQFIQWHVGDRTITMVGMIGLDALITAARGVRPATGDEWRALVNSPPVIVHPSTDDSGAATTPIAQIGQNTTTLGSTYTVSLSDEQSATVTVNEERPADPASTGTAVHVSTESSLAIHPDPDHPLLTLETINATILVVAFDTPRAATALRVTVDGMAPVTVPITQVDTTTLYGAAYAFVERSDYTASLVDELGDVVEVLHA